MPSLVEPVVRQHAIGPKQPTILSDGKGFVLRPWSRNDAEQLRLAFEDEQIQRWCLHKLADVPEGRNWIERWRARWRKGTGASWAIADESRPDIVLGQIGFRSLYLDDGLAELSCWIMPGTRGQHIGTEATRLLADWAFERLKLVRLEIIHSIWNKASCPVALHAGFRIEGVKRHLQLHADKEFHDMCMHARIKSDDGRPIRPVANDSFDAVQRLVTLLQPHRRNVS